MKTAVALLLVITLAQVQAASLDPAAVSWGDFARSKDPADAKLVAEIERMDWFKVCAAWGREARSRKSPRRMFAMQNFLMARTLVNGIDLGAVRAKQPEIGMTLCGVVAAMGMPEAVNQTRNALNHHSQLVYRSRHMYVYTDGDSANGLVTSIQF